MKVEDRLQVRAFYAAHKLLSHLPKEERFLTAICQTSDERYAIAKKENPELVKQWIMSNSRRV